MQHEVSLMNKKMEGRMEDGKARIVAFVFAQVLDLEKQKPLICGERSISKEGGK